ncbi:MAG TPA: metal-sulfur cluster assembly factor [Armatimonadetes bacterium]|nr:metal-sulfur cluster assembly factor [Armatimonadota bacterium]
MGFWGRKRKEEPPCCREGAEGPVTEQQVWEALKGVYDPELPVSIVDLGLVDEVKVEGPSVTVKMLFTAPGCPMVGYIFSRVREEVLKLPGVKEVQVEVVKDKTWTPERLTEEGRRRLRSLTGMGP